MTTTEAPQGPSRSPAFLVATGVLAVTVIVLVLLFGVARPPSLATLAEQPDPAPPASVAWIDRDGDLPCLRVATPEGDRAEVVCDDDLGEPIAWGDDGIVVRTWDVVEELRVFDPATGDEGDRQRIDDTITPDVHRDTEVVTRTRDRTLTVTVRETDQVAWEADVHENYHVRAGTRSPDGAWVALVDSAGRLLIVPADGSSAPRVWADEVTTWDLILWEGTELPTPES